MRGFLTNLVIFIVMGCGWYMRRSGRITAVGLKELNALLFVLLMPLGFFKAGLGFDASTIRGWRFPSVLIGGYVAATAVAWVLAGMRHTTPERRAVAILTAVRPNAIFVGLPVISLWLGQAGAEAQMLFVAVGMPYFNLVPLLLAQFALSGRTDGRTFLNALARTVRNPILLAGAAGILIGAAGWTPLLPDWSMRVVEVLGNCGNGMSLLAIGAALAPEKLLRDIRSAWPDMLMKLFIHPAVVMLAFVLFPVENPVLMRVAVVASAVAPAFNCYVLAGGFGMDSEYAAVLVASSTLFCLLTLLFWMSVASSVFV